MNKLAQISLIASTAGLATAGSLELDRSYAADLRSDASSRALLANTGAGVQVDVGLRFNYTYNSRDVVATAGPPAVNADDDTTIGFSFDDVEIRLSGDVTDNIRATISFDFGEDDGGIVGGSSSSNSVNLEDAYADWTVNDQFTLRIGQFVPQFSAEASTSRFHMTNGDRSVTHETIGTPAWTQGIEAHFGGDTWSGAVGFNDGPGTGNTAFNSPAEADFGLNARFDIFSDSDKARFADQTSWRGSAAGWRVGAGLIYSTFGDTNPAGTGGDAVAYTIDGAYEADGWALRAAFYGISASPDAGPDSDNYGFELGGSFFFNDQWEGYGRYDVLIIDDVLLGAGVEDTYNFVAVGANYYLVPESHAAKLQFEVGVSLDETPAAAAFTGAGPGVTGGTTNFLGSTDDGEFYASLRATFQF
jgi:hypothetical protein